MLIMAVKSQGNALVLLFFFWETEIEDGEVISIIKGTKEGEFYQDLYFHS